MRERPEHRVIAIVLIAGISLSIGIWVIEHVVLGVKWWR